MGQSVQGLAKIPLQSSIKPNEGLLSVSGSLAALAERRRVIASGEFEVRKTETMTDSPSARAARLPHLRRRKLDKGDPVSLPLTMATTFHLPGDPQGFANTAASTIRPGMPWRKCSHISKMRRPSPFHPAWQRSRPCSSPC